VRVPSFVSFRIAGHNWVLLTRIENRGEKECWKMEGSVIKRQLVVAILVVIVSGGSGIKTNGATSITEDFNGATITSALQQNPGGAYAFGGVAHVTNDVRSYISTVASDFNLVDSLKIANTIHGDLPSCFEQWR
jgi:hypothetical protein